jgi:hypothetical protein
MSMARIRPELVPGVKIESTMSASMDRDCGLAVDACVAMSSYSRCEM